MIPQDGYRGLFHNAHNQKCECGMCVPMEPDWSELSNTEKMAKMIILKAQIAAQDNANKLEN